MAWTQVLGVCEGFADGGAGMGSASGVRATAVAATVFDHPRMHASSRQVRPSDDFFCLPQPNLAAAAGVARVGRWRLGPDAFGLDRGIAWGSFLI
ncbi:MAG: hypothetical protein JF591_12240 [Lysobacter sp.]|nr:hypothetical protein [Lysobacter sp.]